MPNRTFCNLEKYTIYLFTGTNWSFEIVSMILKKSAKRVTDEKMFTMLECHSEEEMEKGASPRLLNTHYLPS